VGEKEYSTPGQSLISERVDGHVDDARGGTLLKGGKKKGADEVLGTPEEEKNRTERQRRTSTFMSTSRFPVS